MSYATVYSVRLTTCQHARGEIGKTGRGAIAATANHRHQSPPRLSTTPSSTTDEQTTDTVYATGIHSSRRDDGAPVFIFIFAVVTAPPAPAAGTDYSDGDSTYQLEARGPLIAAQLPLYPAQTTGFGSSLAPPSAAPFTITTPESTFVTPHVPNPISTRILYRPPSVGYCIPRSNQHNHRSVSACVSRPNVGTPTTSRTVSS
ncbi:hypothetical protein EIP86_008210 [Pleurotus ostreatoroseus]|nr:hypothetical protein EIP86_008210 [Pleurotus ostreatoroseus]